MTAVLGDWRNVIEFAVAQDAVAAGDGDRLSDALDDVASTGVPVRSEMVHQYLRTLDLIQQKDPATGRSVLGLGNVLLEQAAAGDIGGPLPVMRCADGTVPVPAAAPGTTLPIGAAGPLTPQQIRTQAQLVTDSIEATWWTRGVPREALGVRGATSPVVFEVEKYSDRTSDLAGRRIDLRVQPADTPAAGAVHRQLQSAYALVTDVDPELADEIAALTEYVVPLEGDQFVGGSDLLLFGATFLRLDPGWSTLCYADHLIHEAAHQLLHAVQELEPLLLNRDQVGQPSPIRSDARPLYGSFHATFVFLRLARFMCRMAESGPLEHRGEAEIRLHRHLLGLLQGLHILQAHARFSDEGRAEFESWIAVAGDLLERVGTPDERLVAQLTWDYEPANTDLALLAV